MYTERTKQRQKLQTHKIPPTIQKQHEHTKNDGTPAGNIERYEKKLEMQTK